MSDVLVLGSSLPALRAALDCAELGLAVTVVRDESESAARPANRDELRDSSGALAALMRELAEPLPGPDMEHRRAKMQGLLPTARIPDPPLLRSSSGSFCAQSVPNVWGIPAVPLARSVIELIGWGGAIRAHRDRVAPLLTIGKTREFGRLVRNRIGSRAASILVDPQVRERFGVSMDEVDTAVAAPGLNETLTRAGSLTAAALAYAERHASEETLIRPLDGWDALRAALEDRLLAYGAEILDTAPETIDADAEGDWHWTDGTGAQTSRALIIGDGHAALAGEVGEELLRAEDAPLRFYADIGIEGWETKGLDNEAEAVIEADYWVVRVLPGGRARVAGPRVRATPESGLDLHESMRRALHEALGQCGLRKAGDCRESVEIAPFITVLEREQARSRWETLRSRWPSLVPVGEAFSGGDVSLGMSLAHSAAVQLRRELLGLSEA